MESPSHYPDGPIDAIVDVTHLSEKVKQLRRNAYNRWVVPEATITTAAGQILKFDLGREEENVKLGQLGWKTDGQVSIAKVSCQRCAEINSCREEGSPPFVCLIRAGGVRRSDGTSQCAFCFCNSYTNCRAKGGESAAVESESEESEDCEDSWNKKSPDCMRRTVGSYWRDLDKCEQQGAADKGNASRRNFGNEWEGEVEEGQVDDGVEAWEDGEEGDEVIEASGDDSTMISRRYSNSGRKLRPVKKFIPVKGAKKARRSSAASKKGVGSANQTAIVDLTDPEVIVPVIMPSLRRSSISSVITENHQVDNDDGDDISPQQILSTRHSIERARSTFKRISTDTITNVNSTSRQSSSPIRQTGSTSSTIFSDEKIRKAHEEYEEAAVEVLALKRAKYFAMVNKDNV